MDLNNTKIILRPRNNWAAADLGLIMVKTWWKSLYSSWFIITFPIFSFAVGLVALFSSCYYVPFVLVVFWWFKPIWERSLLHVLSRAVFGDNPGALETLKSFPGLAKKQALLSLTLRRFSPFRSFDLPVVQLENLSGKDRQNRIRVLHNDRNSATVWALFACLYCESILVSTSIGLAFLFVPDEVDLDLLAFWQSNQSAVIIMIVYLVYLSMSLITPIYVACGFSSYLNRRTILEGWDLELGFRKLKERFSKSPHLNGKTSNPLKSILIVLLFGFSVLTGTGIDSAYADNSNKVELKGTVNRLMQSKNLIKHVLEGEAFHQVKSSRTLKFRYDWFDDINPDIDPKWAKGLKTFMLFIVSTFEIAFWIILIAIIILLIYTFRHSLKNLRFIHPVDFLRHNNISPRYEEDDLHKIEISNNITDKALQLWQKEKPREALGLLYRAALALLVQNYSMDLKNSFTEEECVRLVNRNQPKKLARFFKKLTTTWQMLAYGHRIPEKGAFTLICSEWTQVFMTNESQ